MKSSPYDILIHPYVTEKTMFQMERENKLEFLVRRKASKNDVKDAFEQLFEVKVVSVNTRILKDGKHATIKLHPDFSAEDIGMRIGVF